jgi:hypothetical protein
MSDDDKFSAEVFRIEDSEDEISLIFENAGGEHRSVSLRRSSIPELISLLVPRSEVVTPIRSGLTRAETVDLAVGLVKTLGGAS